MTTTMRPTARERLLKAAGELFYEEGVQTVGIDRIIEHAGVAKASLYNTFGSKDELVHAYLADRHQGIRARVEAAIARHRDPRERLLAVFTSQAEFAAGGGHRGCAFYAACAETRPESRAAEAADDYRRWLHDLFTGLAREAGAPDPEALGAQLRLLYDGGGVGVRMDEDATAPLLARRLAATLLDAVLT